MHKAIRCLLLASTIVCVLWLGACNKKVAKVVTPPPATSVAPTATLAANPSFIQQGESTELTWTTSNANSVSIDAFGVVPASGSKIVYPSDSKTYTLSAKGQGGTQQVEARVTVNPATTQGPALPMEDLFSKNVRDIYFSFDQSDLSSDQQTTAQTDASFLAQHPNINVVIEGHCDDRGSEEYNLALGDRRANSLRSSLLAQGISPDRIQTLSYGKEHPFCTQDGEGCWQQNRRDHLALRR